MMVPFLFCWVLSASSGFDHLGQKHLAGAKQVADGIHAIHQRPFNHFQRIAQFMHGLFGVGVDVFHYAMHQRMRQAL